MNLRPSATIQLVTVAVIVGIAQVVASVALSLAKPEALALAAAEGPILYVLGVSGVAAAWLVAWFLRARVLLALGLGVAGTVVIIGVSASSGSALGLIYFGELLIHHFLALLAAAICLAVGRSIFVDPDLGGLRRLPLLFAGVGGALLLVQHVVSLPVFGLDLEFVWRLGSASSLLAIAATWVLLWPLYSWSDRLLSVCLLAPLVVRIVIGGAAGLSGAVPGVSAAMPMMVAITSAGIAAFLLLGKRVDVFARVLSLLVGGLVSYRLDGVYQGPHFQFYEERLGGLVRSIFGFELPYPSFVAGWKTATATVAIFTMTAAISAALLDRSQRARALALALVVVAGLGLTTPQLLLMQAAGSLVLLACLREGPVVAVSPVACPPPEEPEQIFAELAERLGVAAPVVIEEPVETLLAIRGEHRQSALDLRARTADHLRWVVVLACGVLGRGRPDAEVLPGRGGHRLRGDVRRVGGEESGVLAALSAFPTATARFWEAGCEVEFGDDLTRLGAASLEALIRAIGRQLRAS